VTAPQHAPQVAAYLGADRLRLSPASLETLSVVAYRQPVTRAEVEAIRGVNCDQTFYTLASRRLIEERKASKQEQDECQSSVNEV